MPTADSGSSPGLTRAWPAPRPPPGCHCHHPPRLPHRPTTHTDIRRYCTAVRSLRLLDVLREVQDYDNPSITSQNDKAFSIHSSACGQIALQAWEPISNQGVCGLRRSPCRVHCDLITSYTRAVIQLEHLSQCQCLEMRVVRTHKISVNFSNSLLNFP